MNFLGIKHLKVKRRRFQKELNSEALAYMKYLDEQVEREKVAEQELEKLIDEEVRNYWFSFYSFVF